MTHEGVVNVAVYGSVSQYGVKLGKTKVHREAWGSGVETEEKRMDAKMHHERQVRKEMAHDMPRRHVSAMHSLDRGL